MSKRKQSWSPQKAWLGKKLLKVGGEIATATGHPIAGATADMMHNAIERSERQEMELDATDDAGTESAGSNLRRNNLPLPTPLFKHSYECEITKTTQCQLEWLDKDQAYFFPTSIYDWFLTEPAHNDTAGWTYQYIPAYKDLFFYDTIENRTAKKDFFHFVRPLSASVHVSDLIFFSDEVKTGTTTTLASYGFESAYILYGNRFLPEKYSVDVIAAKNGYMSQTLFAKETLPICTLSRYEAMDSAHVTAIHGGSGFSFDVPIHQPLMGHANFIKPVVNAYSSANQGTYTNFTWLPQRNAIFRDIANACDVTGAALKDAPYLYNFNGFKHLGWAPHPKDLANPLHVIWFPEINKAGEDTFKLRASFFLTTKFKARFYSKFPVHDQGTTTYFPFESYLGQLYKTGSYNTFAKYPVTAVI